MKRYLMLSSLLSLSIDNGDSKYKITGPKDIPTGGLITKGPDGTTSAQIILRNAATYIFVGGIILALFFLLWGGISWVTSGGDKNKVQAARNKIIYSILGLLVMFFSYFIVNLVGDFFGVEPFYSTVIPDETVDPPDCPERGVPC